MPPSEANRQLSEMRKMLGERDQQLEALAKDRDAAVKEKNMAQSEAERLLQVMQMGQEEQFDKDKTIRELQE